MSYEQSGMFLLKRWSKEKSVDHYAVGLGGEVACQAGYRSPVAIQLLPGGVVAEPWTANDGWSVLARASDLDQAADRLRNTLSASYALVDSNCEHFARHVITGVRESRQVQAAAILSVIAVLVAFGR